MNKNSVCPKTGEKRIIGTHCVFILEAYKTYEHPLPKVPYIYSLGFSIPRKVSRKIRKKKLSSKLDEAYSLVNITDKELLKGLVCEIKKYINTHKPEYINCSPYHDQYNKRKKVYVLFMKDLGYECVYEDFRNMWLIFKRII